MARQEDRSTLKGRLAVERQFTQLAGRADRLACRFDEFSVDIDLNRILATAAEALLKLTRSSSTRQALAHALGQLDGVSLLPPDVLPAVHLNHLMERFARAHAFARLFLQARHQTTTSGDDAGQAILFRMNVLFEAYVTQAVRRAAVRSGWRVTAQGPQRPALWRGSSGLFQMKPDIALHRDRCTLILDAKWKQLTPHARDPRRGIAQADIYQIMAYSESYAADAVALVYPHSQGNEPLDRLQIGVGARNLVVAALPVADTQALESAIPELMGWMMAEQIGGGPLR